MDPAELSNWAVPVAAAAGQEPCRGCSPPDVLVALLSDLVCDGTKGIQPSRAHADDAGFGRLREDGSRGRRWCKGAGVKPQQIGEKNADETIRLSWNNVGIGLNR